MSAILAFVTRSHTASPGPEVAELWHSGQHQAGVETQFRGSRLGSRGAASSASHLASYRASAGTSAAGSSPVGDYDNSPTAWLAVPSGRATPTGANVDALPPSPRATALPRARAHLAYQPIPVDAAMARRSAEPQLEQAMTHAYEEHARARYMEQRELDLLLRLRDCENDPSAYECHREVCGLTTQLDAFRSSLHVELLSAVVVGAGMRC
jgi:hypothetical protein